jgi:hypothetical protein
MYLSSYVAVCFMSFVCVARYLWLYLTYQRYKSSQPASESAERQSNQSKAKQPASRPKTTENFARRDSSRALLFRFLYFFSFLSSTIRSHLGRRVIPCAPVSLITFHFFFVLNCTCFSYINIYRNIYICDTHQIVCYIQIISSSAHTFDQLKLISKKSCSI